ncbi:MAG: nucleoside kinase [Deltaproteobacteria bacterium]|nr:nucleoside kinase [Deltaproteobacteria bacterium]
MTSQKPSAHEEPAEISYRGQLIEVPRGTPISKLKELYPQDDDDRVFAALMNNQVVSLSSQILRSGKIEPIRFDSSHGARIYRRHITLMLYEVFYSRYPSCKIRVGQAISEGYYFEVEGTKVDDEFLGNLRQGLEDLAAAKRPFVFKRVPVEDARRQFVNKGSPVKREILRTWPSGHVGIMSVGNFVDFAFGPIAPHTGYFKDFKLLRQGEDFILQFPDPRNPDLRRSEGPQPKLYSTLKESRRWSELLGVAHVGDLNRTCIDGSVREVIKIAEGLHEKKISDIASELAEIQNHRLVFIAGPSAAGKTTFTMRLLIQLKVNGLAPVSISLDNYYVDRNKTPRDEDGNYDFEALEAIDLELFNTHMKKILAGEKVLTPRYDFGRGRRSSKKKWRPIELGRGQVLVIEGIHGLNKALTPAIPEDEKFRIYINALNPLTIDEHNRLHTSDTRLIRRIVRDRHYRGYSAADTIHSWPSVRRGERRHIFPFQESADVTFDSSLIYEFSVFKIFAERYLLEVSRTDPAFAEAFRLRRFLSMFVAILPEDTPQTSLIREFIGGSSFSY